MYICAHVEMNKYINKYIYIYTHRYNYIYRYIYIHRYATYAYTHPLRCCSSIYDAGLPHPPSPPPTPWYPPLPVKWVVVLFALLLSPSGLVWPRPIPPVEWGLWSVWLDPPRLWGAVCSTEIWYGCCRLLAVMSSLRARYHTKYDVALFSLHTLPLSLL